MHMDILLVKRHVDAEHLRMGLQERECCARAFLHHIAQFARQDDLPAAGHDLHFDLEQLPAYARPRKAIHDTCDVLLMRRHVKIAHRPQILLHALRCKPHARFSFADLAGGLAAHLGKRPFQRAHARFARIAADQLAHHLVRDIQHGFLQPMLFHLLRQQVALCDFPFFVLEVTRHLDHFHAVKQRPRDGIRAVRSRNEHDLGKVVRHFKEVVAKRVVLRAVKHLQHCGSRVTPHVACELIDLVKQQHRVHGTGLPHGCDHAPGHRADVGAAVAADLRLIMDAAKAHAHEFPSEGAGDGFRNGGLSHARRADKAEDLPGDLPRKAGNGNVLQDAFLHLFEAVMILIQHSARMGKVKVILRLFRPGKIQHAFDVVAQRRFLMRTGGKPPEAVDLLFHGFPYRIRHGFLFQPFKERIRVVLLRFAQFRADGLDLLAQIVFLLVFVHPALDFL